MITLGIKDSKSSKKESNENFASDHNGITNHIDIRYGLNMSLQKCTHLTYKLVIS